MQTSRSITPEKIEATIKRVVSVAQPRKVILFGSVVSATQTLHSDLNILVVTKDEVESRCQESVRIRRAFPTLSPLPPPEMPNDTAFLPFLLLSLLTNPPERILINQARPPARHT